MSYSMKNALADFKKEELADGMIAVLKEQAKSLERKNENGVTSLKLITQGTIDYIRRKFAWMNNTVN